MKEAEFIVFLATLFDNIWHARNIISHGGKSPSVKDMVTVVSQKAHAYWCSTIKAGILKTKLPQHWVPPPIDWIKINADSSFIKGKACAGVVIRNTNGTLLHARTTLHSCLDASAAEGYAILDACILLSKLKYKKAIIESDCLDAISFINGSSSNCYWTISPSIEEIRNMWLDWPFCFFKFVPRSANRAAHSLANWAHFCNIEGDFGCVGTRQEIRPGELGLLDLAWALHETDEKAKLVDRRMGPVVNPDQAIRVLEVGLLCTLNGNKGRPNMEEVVEYLNFERPVPELPTTRPVSLFPYSSTTGLCSGYSCASF
ncbi:hypothetical protein CASFOL_003433 [Castilleja foliolosa]|uniref:RNase H type-1 domain-containing protein n=1 Tax=Castilleja foliolosa TaxID=1961234 RepID=A0ABD3EJ22_9LAMI